MLYKLGAIALEDSGSILGILDHLLLCLGVIKMWYLVATGQFYWT